MFAELRMRRRQTQNAQTSSVFPLDKARCGTGGFFFGLHVVPGMEPPAALTAQAQHRWPVGGERPPAEIQAAVAGGAAQLRFSFSHALGSLGHGMN